MDHGDVSKQQQQGCTNCRRCSKRFLAKPTSFQSIKDLVRLYSTGAYELGRQLVTASPQPILSSTEYQGLLAELQEQSLTVIITGGTSGIGRSLLEILRAIASHIILLAHPSHGLSVKVDHQIPVDFASRNSTAIAVDALLQHLSVLPKQRVVLFHCAAVYNPQQQTTRPTGSCSAAQITFQINTIMPTLLLHRIHETVDVIVLISSSAQYCAPIIDEATCPFCSVQTPYAAYPMSKLMMLANADIWARTWEKRVVAIHPGIVATSLYDSEPGILGNLLRAVVRNLAWTPYQSAVRVLKVLCSTNVLQLTPKLPAGRANQPFPSTQIYWDTVSMCPAALPTQMVDESGRLSAAQWTHAHFNL